MEEGTRENTAAQLKELCDTILSHRPLIVASNRGPVEHQMTAEGRPEARRGSGSVVTALNSLSHSAEYTWVASAMGEGDRVASNEGQGRLKSPLSGHKIHLRYVVTPRRVYHKYYNVFCNPLLWFLQHYMWNPPYSPNVDAAIHDAWLTGYIPVNQAFAQAVVQETQRGAEPPVVIGHDYHLYLLPKYVRQELPDAIIEHFVHVPWPTPRYWQMIPNYMTRQICSSLCAVDLLGFQTPQDRRSFLNTVEEFLPEAEVDHREWTVVWRDPHLTPKYVRQELPDAIIEHFVHVPWPTPRYWQMIPNYIYAPACARLTYWGFRRRKTGAAFSTRGRVSAGSGGRP